MAAARRSQQVPSALLLVAWLALAACQPAAAAASAPRKLLQLQRPELAVTGELVQQRQPTKFVAAELEAVARSRLGDDGGRRLLDAATNQFITSTLDKLPTFQPERAVDLTVSGDLVQRRQPAKQVTAQLEASAGSRFAAIAGARRLQQQQQHADLSVSGNVVQERQPARAVVGGVEAAAKSRFADSRRSSGIAQPRPAQPAINEISAAVKARFTDISQSNAQVSNQSTRRLLAAQEAVAAKVLTGSKRLGKGAPVHMQQAST